MRGMGALPYERLSVRFKSCTLYLCIVEFTPALYSDERAPNNAGGSTFEPPPYISQDRENGVHRVGGGLRSLRRAQEAAHDRVLIELDHRSESVLSLSRASSNVSPPLPVRQAEAKLPYTPLPAEGRA